MHMQHAHDMQTHVACGDWRKGSRLMLCTASSGERRVESDRGDLSTTYAGTMLGGVARHALATAYTYFTVRGFTDSDAVQLSRVQ